MAILNLTLVSTTEGYSILEDDIMIYDVDETFQGEFLSAQIRRWPKTGNNVVIPFIKKAMFSYEEKDKALKRAIQEFDTKTCIR